MGKIIEMVALTALVAVEHDGVKYGPGEEAGDKFEAPKTQAQPLLDVGAAKLTVDEAAADAATPAAKTAAQKK